LKKEKAMGTIFGLKQHMTRQAKTNLPFSVVICLILPAAFQFFGCSTGRPPIEAFSKAELRLRTAAEARADELAPMDLQRAKEKLEQARKAMAAGKNDEARRLAEAADVEAELAEARAEAEITRLAADNVRRRSDALRQELEGAATRGSATEASGGR
jgi:multidrug efflux pump subunit AcrA (membrane-fusion protein)